MRPEETDQHAVCSPNRQRERFFLLFFAVVVKLLLGLVAPGSLGCSTQNMAFVAEATSSVNIRCNYAECMSY